MEIDELLEKAKNGDKEAFGYLYKIFYNRIYRYCRINLYNRFYAEDACQEIFVRAWRAITRFSIRDGGTFQAFLFKIARNLIIDLSRKKKEAPIKEWVDTPSNEDLIENQARNDEAESVKRALHKLEDKDRQIIILRYFEDLSHREVAKILGITEGALRVRTMRLLKKLKELI